ncbi:MAG TPA: hypothetical protein VMW36_05490 [Patescibacteria group bacterium]|nr:hypothetical protein [Patescibacteria group bacterium]
MPQRRLLLREIKFLEEAASADIVSINIRLREGEYQYNLVKAIASFQLDLMFPDVKDLIGRLYGQEKALDLQFVRKIQTILKKMEKSGIVRILPKKNPWQLQRYALSSFRFQDSDKNLIVLATDQQMKQAQDGLRSALTEQDTGGRSYLRTLTLTLILVVSYAVAVWALVQPNLSPIVFVPGLSVSVICSLLLGKVLAEK